MSEFLRQAFSRWDCIYLCEAEGGLLWERLRAALSFQDAREGTVTIAADWQLTPPTGPLLTIRQELPRESAVRASLRQDPDCIVLDQGDEVAPLLLQAALTGHRVIAGFRQPARQVLQALLGGNHELVSTQSCSLFFDPEGLLLYRPEQDEFERVSLWRGGAFHDLAIPEAPVQPSASPTFPPQQAPEEWGPPCPLLPGLEAKLGPLARVCYSPQWADCSALAPVNRFGGQPLLEPGQNWPRCGACAERLQLICQLNLQCLPETGPLPAEGWLQFFYCTNDHCHHPNAWEPFRSNSLVRVLKAGVTSPEAPPSPQFPPRAIVGWTALTDYPGWEERPELDERERTASYNLEEPAFLEHFGLTGESDRQQAEAYFRNYPGDKLFGWPAWSQAIDYPACPQCSQPMRMFLQINNDGQNSQRAGYDSCYGQIFAGDGNGHIFVCPQHPGQLTFSWACG